MGKHGPCYHCGTTSTPLWRNGPPEKPILCNACGSRWRTKGSLANYTPLHARAEPDEYNDYRIQRAKSMSIRNKEPKVLKRKQNHENKLAKVIAPDYNYDLLQTMDVSSNRSSSGSAITNSESCVQFGSFDASDFAGPAQSGVWEQMVPSRKRTCVDRPKQSQVEKLTKDLHTILHEQQSSHFSGSSEEDLLFESDRPLVSVEIGHGSVLIRHPSSIAQEEESEASSVMVENKMCLLNSAYSRSTAFPVCVNKDGVEKRHLGHRIQEENINRDKDEHEKLLILRNHNSPLCYVDLKDIINFDVFASHLSNEEQQQLLQFLPQLETNILLDSLQSIFAGPEFEENLLSFQKLLSEGIFDFPSSGVKAEGCGTLKRLALCGSEKSTRVDPYGPLKDKEANSGKRGADVLPSGTSTNAERSHVGSGTKTAVKGPGYKGLLGKSGSVFDARGRCSSPRNPLTVDSFQCMDENSDPDLLLDVPSNNAFLEAELLCQTSPSSSSVYPFS